MIDVHRVLGPNGIAGVRFGASPGAVVAGLRALLGLPVADSRRIPDGYRMVREIKGILALGPRVGWQVPIVRTEALRGEGVEELMQRLAEHRVHIEAEGTLLVRRRRNLQNEVLAIAAHRMRRALEESLREDPQAQALLERVVARELDPASAAKAILAARPERGG